MPIQKKAPLTASMQNYHAQKMAKLQAIMNQDDQVCMGHCDQGEYEDSCKYGRDDCPVMGRKKKMSSLKNKIEKL